MQARDRLKSFAIQTSSVSAVVMHQSAYIGSQYAAAVQLLFVVCLSLPSTILFFYHITYETTNGRNRSNQQREVPPKIAKKGERLFQDAILSSRRQRDRQFTNLVLIYKPRSIEIQAEGDEDASPEVDVDRDMGKCNDEMIDVLSM